MPTSTMGDALVLSMMPQVTGAPIRAGSKAQQSGGGDFGSVIEETRLSNAGNSDQSVRNDTTLQNTGQKDSQSDVRNEGRTSGNDDQNKIKDRNDSKTDKTKDESNKVDDKKDITKAKDTDNLKKLHDQSEEISEDLEEAGIKLFTQIADELDVTDEEVLEVLATLGMTITDLFNPENLTQVVMEVTGTSDVSDILMDEDLSGTLQELMASARKMIEDIAADYDAQPEEVDQMLATLKELDKGHGMLQNIQNPKDMKVQDPKALEDKIEINFEDKELSENEQIHRNLGAGRHEEGEKSFKGEEQNLFSQNEELKTPEMNPYQQMVNDLKNAFNEAVTQRHTPEQGPTNPVDVINQITEYMKVNIKEEMTSLEIQLHPASLGTVKVMLEQAQDGGVNAKFTASTQEAKAALQTQLIQLQQKLDEQGIKVNAVEVAVDAHAFEQNLEKGNQQSEAEQEEKRQSRIRRINLGNPDLLQEDTLELDEEERLVAEMMAANGQTVDYTA